jgi:small subunit ribosomal protein S21
MEMPCVRVRENLSLENALRKFKKQCEREGILSEIKKREHFEKPSVKRGGKAVAARKKTIKRVKLAVR